MALQPVNCEERIRAGMSLALQPVNSEGRLRAGMRFGTATRKKSTDAPPEKKNKRSSGAEVEESTA